MESETAPDPATSWEPVGLLAAAEQVAGDAEAEGASADGAPEPGDDQVPPRALPWDRVVGLVVDLAFGRLAQRDELWKLAPDERAALCGAWGDYLQTVALAPGPLSAALLATGVVVGPRVLQSAARRRTRVRDAEASEAS